VSEQLAWAQWWARPWMSSHDDWRTPDKYPAINMLCISGASVAYPVEGVTPSLPPAPNSTVLRLALASTQQLDFVLALIENTCNPMAMLQLEDNHDIWCRRLAKALLPHMLSPGEDPLQLLRIWVETPVWQRLRFLFPYQRIIDLEKSPPSYQIEMGRLDTLWQAVVWRMSTLTVVNISLDAHTMEN
jgi:hypothetical protein